MAAVFCVIYTAYFTEIFLSPLLTLPKKFLPFPFFKSSQLKNPLISSPFSPIYSVEYVSRDTSKSTLPNELLSLCPLYRKFITVYLRKNAIFKMVYINLQRVMEMPANSQLSKGDPIVMTPSDVNNIIAELLQQKGFNVKKGTSHSEVDIRAIKDGFELIIESRGNQAYKNKGTDQVFESSQLDIHLSEHVTQIMRFQQSISTNKKPIFIMGNPDIPRIKERVTKISKGLDKLDIVRFWVNNQAEIIIEGPKDVELTLKHLL